MTGPDYVPWIQNVSLASVQEGLHFDAGINSMLIQIVDQDMSFPVPKYTFKEVHQFKFLDIEDAVSGEELDVLDQATIEELGIKRDDAARIASLLQHALAERMNVVVHCVAGICRSGAVCEVGCMIGFRDLETYRHPNTRVKRMLLEELGMDFDPAKSVFNLPDWE